MVMPEGMVTQIVIFLFICGLQFGASSHSREQEPSHLNISDMLLQNPSPIHFSIILFYEKFFENLQTGPKVNISEPCARASHFLALAAQRGESWALRMIDALGKPSSGIMEGSVVFLGFYSECVTTTAIPPKNTTMEDFLPFRGKYCLPTLSFAGTTSTPPQGIPGPSYTVLSSSHPKIGLCIPSTCSVNDVSLAFNLAVSQVAQGWTASIPHCYTHENVISDDAAAIAVMTVLLAVVCLVVISTVLDMFIHEVWEINLRLRRKQINGSLEILCDQQDQTNTDNKVIQVLRALSLKRNAQKLLNTSTSEESIDILHGIRFLTIVWIITGHSCSFAVQWLFFKGGVNMKNMSRMFWIQPLVNGTLSVDTFFFLSGFLVTLLTLKQLTKSEGKLPLAWFYFHRYWRMTPLMMAIIAFSAVLLRYVGEGPAWLDTIIMYDTWCKKNWWLNALYLHNFIDTSNMCLSHTWYSAVDFQLYIISPLIIYPLYRGLRWGLPVLLGFFIATTVSTGVITGTQHLPPIPVLNDAIPTDVLARFSSIVYIKPYCRAGPYLVGMALGYILFKFPSDVVLKKKYVVLGWCLAATCNILVLYGM